MMTNDAAETNAIARYTCQFSVRFTFIFCGKTLGLFQYPRVSGYEFPNEAKYLRGIALPVACSRASGKCQVKRQT